MWSDVRFGLRLLVRNPGIALAVVVSLALGLGATTAMFSLLNSLMFKALPVPEPERLVVLNHGAGADLDSSFTYPQLAGLRGSAAAAVDLFGYSGSSNRFAYGHSERTVQTQFVSGDYFRILRVRPAAGRLLEPADNLRGSPSATSAVISYRLWQSVFQGDPAIAGRTVRIDSVPFTVAGVTPPSFFGVETGADPDVTLPFAARLALNPQSTMLDCQNCYWLSIMGRLAPGVTAASAEAGLKVIWQNVRQATMSPDLPQHYRAEYFADRVALLPGSTGISFLRTRFTQPLYVLLAITALILLISCSNVANLLMARAQARQRELAIRVAIGAARGRLVRQLLTESALLAAAGLLAGIAVYRFCVGGLLRFLHSGGQDIYLDTAPDLRLVAFAGGAALLTLALFGLIPSLRATARPSSHSVTARSSFTRVVLCGQIALSFTLLVGATLLARSLYDLRTFPAGFRRDHLVLLSPDASGRALYEDAARVRYTRTLLDQIRALPGVRSASASVVIPMGGTSWQRDFAAGATSGHAYVNLVMPDFFRTMGTRLIMGRDLTEKDDAASPHIAVVNESFARRYWPGQNPLGKPFHETDKAAILTVAGVVEDAKYRDFRQNAPPTVYLPLLQRASTEGWSLNLEVWTYTDPQALIRPIARLLGGVETTIRTFTELIDRRLLYERLLTSLSVAFGALGILICAVGIYGVAAYSVSRRTAEIGIRMALGATPGHVMRRILREQALLLGAGLAAGAAGALLLTRFLRTWLFGVSPTDIPTLLAGMLCLAIVTGIATSLPARRAAAIEPLRALRHE
ncbi:MAG: ABC transporter permease [Candidatus Sulfopaludibacter sp.]|nr:ABC transporter permease [Candidatus Sulfopaludibacter sp.]